MKAEVESMSSRVWQWLLPGIAIVFFFVTTSCSVSMATKQPDEKNLSLLAQGTPRSALIAEFGRPVATEMNDGRRTDVFSFIQGYSKGTKISRAIFHGVADAMTIGLWEAVGTPLEGAFDGTRMKYKITYDQNNKAEKVTPLEIETEAPTHSKSQSAEAGEWKRTIDASELDSLSGR